MSRKEGSISNQLSNNTIEEKQSLKTIKISSRWKETNGRKRKKGSILRDESGPATAEWRETEEAGKKDKGRSDEGIYPILAGVAAGCRAQEGDRWLVLFELESTERKGEREIEGEDWQGTWGPRGWLVHKGETLIRVVPLIKCAFIRASCAPLLPRIEFATRLSGGNRGLPIKYTDGFNKSTCLASLLHVRVLKIVKRKKGENEEYIQDKSSFAVPLISEY